MDLSPCTRVYIQGGCWVSNRSGFWPVWSSTVWQIPIKRSLDLFRLMWWTSYLGFQYGIMERQPSAWICHLLNLWKDLEDPGGACMSPLYTSNWLFSESRLLAIFGLPWPMTMLQTLLWKSAKALHSFPQWVLSTAEWKPKGRVMLLKRAATVVLVPTCILSVITFRDSKFDFSKFRK